ncbi:MAG TPA: alpha/beta hydrolase [Solirubrobacteraceae bacterium]|jgi:pimeloyl-ACP methyl ester carboxylesterase
MIRIPADGDYGRSGSPTGPPTDWSAHERDTVIDGRRVRYVDIGEGPLGFVCVHGMGGCWQHFSQMLPALARHGRAIALDLPGFGESQMPLRRTTLERFADTAATLASQLGLQRVIFVGHSMGGPIALRFARRHPQLTESLILLAGAVQTFSALLGLRGLRHIARQQPRDTAAIYTEVLTCGIPIPGFAKRAIARHSRLRTSALWPYVHRPRRLQAETIALIMAGAGARAVLPTALAIATSDPYEGLDQIQCPILSIGAEHDHIAPVADLQAFDRMAPQASTVLLEDCGHLMMLERPVALNEQVDRFLAQALNGGPQTRGHLAEKRNASHD